MSTPDMRGFSGIVPYSTNEFADSDISAFKLPVVEPGGTSRNQRAYWFNFGYAYLYNAQLSLVLGGTLDTGTDADTIDRMNIEDYIAFLNYQTPATAVNTLAAGFLYPIQDPFRPFIDKFLGGIKWDPPIGAAIGIIRKCFQWDGSYYPDTWDYIWYPTGNGYLIDNVFYSNPMTEVLSNATATVIVDASAETGYALKYTVDNISAPASIDTRHNIMGTPWYDGVDNATGWVASFKFKWITTHAGMLTLEFVDDASTLSIQIDRYGVHIPAGASYLFDPKVSYQTMIIKMKALAYEIWIDGTMRLSGAPTAPAPGTPDIGYLWPDPLGSPTGACAEDRFKISHLKYFLNGDAEPVY